MDSAVRPPIHEYVSRLDSERFGYLIAKLDRVDSGTAGLLDALAMGGVRLVIARLPAGDVRGIAFLEGRGFRHMDCQLVHRFDFGRRPIDGSSSSTVLVRQAEARDTAGIVAVATESFEGYGHYAADERLDRAACREAYSDWARRSCEEPGVADRIFVAEQDLDVVGFLSFKLRRTGGHDFAAGVMGAVAGRARGRGAFKALLVGGLKWGEALGLQWEEHGSLATNYPVNRAFADVGFRIAEASVTLHGWLDR